MTKQVKHEDYTSSRSDQALVKAKINAQMYLLGKGLKKFGDAGKKASKAELAQMHHRTYFRALAVAELTKTKKLRAMEGLMFLTLKKSGEVKGRLAYNGKPTRQWIGKEDKASPTALTESILLLAGLDAAEKGTLW